MATHATAHDHAHAHGHDDHVTPGFFTRWFMSTNHKDIGVLYLFTAGLVGLISVSFTVYMRMELQFPGVQYMCLEGARFLPAGDAALTVEFGAAIDGKINGRVLALDAALAEAALPGAVAAVLHNITGAVYAWLVRTHPTEKQAVPAGEGTIAPADPAEVSAAT